MSNGASYTRAFVVVTVLLIAVYDIVAITAWGVGATISRVVGVDASFDAPTIPFAFGMLMGHLFWHQPRKQIENGL